MRNYKREYEIYQGKKQQKKNRAKRNNARRKMVRKYGKAKLAGKDIHHIKGIRAGNGRKNLRVLKKSVNRSKK